MKATKFLVLSKNKKFSLEVYGLTSSLDFFLNYIVFNVDIENFLKLYSKGFFIKRITNDLSENYGNLVEYGTWFEILESNFKVENDQITITTRNYIGHELPKSWYSNSTIQFYITITIAIIGIFVTYYVS